MSAQEKVLYVFTDESGDLQFSKKGKQHFILSAVFTEDPLPLSVAVQKLKYELLAKGSEDIEFHATENSWGTRKRVVDMLCALPDYKVHSLYIDKGFTHPDFQTEVKLLTVFGAAMGRWLAKVHADKYDRIIFVFDSVLTGKKQRAFIKDLKQKLKGCDVEFRILFHPVKQEPVGQIADYFSWVSFRYLERGDVQFTNQLYDSLGNRWSAFNVFGKGHTRYWTKTTTPPIG